MLYFDVRLSKGHDLSCNSCHDLASYGVDGKSKSVGHDGRIGHRNAPSVFNAATHIAQFWDGRADTVERQASIPILNPDEMANTSDRVIRTLASIPGYVELFRAAYPGKDEPITMETLGDAIGAFERGLTTTSRWDKFIAGDTKALTAEEKGGLRLFMDVGCMTCHTGPQVGASMYQLVGFAQPWPNQSDLGRAMVTKLDADRMQFKVPSLKNIAETAVLPRRVRRHARGCDPDDGPPPGRHGTDRRRGERDRHLDARADRDDRPGLHRRAQAAAQRPAHAAGDRELIDRGGQRSMRSRSDRPVMP